MRRVYTILAKALLAVGAITLTPKVAQGRALEAVVLSGEKKMRIDGMLREWPAQLDNLSTTVQGTAANHDPEASGAIGYDDKNLYVAMKVRDARFVRTNAYGNGEDHAALLLAFPSSQGYKTYTVNLYAGDPGKIAGAVKIKGGGNIAGAKLVEAPNEGGHLFEASIPWSTFPESKTLRAGMRAALRYYDADSAGSVHTVVATSEGAEGKWLSPLLLENEQGLFQALIRDKNLPESPSRLRVGDIAGDGAREVVCVYGRYLTIVGSAYRGGKEFFFQELGVDDASAILRFDLEDVTGDGKDDIIIQKRVGTKEKHRVVLQVMTVSAGSDAPFSAFQHEIGIVTPDGAVHNEVSFDRKGGKVGIKVSQGEAKGFDPETYAEPMSGDMPSALLPWETVKSRTFRWQGKSFDKVDEQTWQPSVKGPSKQAVTRRKSEASASSEPAAIAPPPPRPPSPDEMQDRLYALYRKDRGVGKGKPRFDFVTDVAGDRTNERVVVHGKDIVAFGKAFKGGTSYVFITVGVEDPKDILDATARDLTGDGKAEIVVRAVLRAQASKQLGGDTVERHGLFVYHVSEDGIQRIFAAETGRTVGANSVFEGIRFVPDGRKWSLELRPWRAVNWSKETYPFPIDRQPYGGLEPLLLPWGGESVRRYKFDGNAFVQQ